MNNLGLRKLQTFCAGVAACCGLLGAGNAQGQVSKQRLVTEAVDEANRVTLHGNVHPLARAEFDQGAMADSQPVNRIYLLLNRSGEQQEALEQLLREQVDETSPNYHKWVTPKEYGAKFGPSDEDVAAVTNWLSSQGFTGIKSNAGRTIVEFNGTVASVRSAFSTDLHRFMVRGEEHFANVSDPKIPAALGKIVAGIPSLHNFRKRSFSKRLGKFRTDDLTGETQALFTYVNATGTGPFFAMGPADFAKIYNIPAGADGTGQSIAIVGRSNINPKDLADFRTMFGLPPLTLVNSLSGCTGATPQFCIILNGADPGLVPGDEGEADLDVEWSGAVAPKATVKFVVSESEQTDAVDGVDASSVFIVDNNIAPVMSVSFGLCEAFQGSGGNAFQNALWQQAAAEGITVSVSSGDNGSAGCDDPNAASGTASHGIGVSGTASTPFNVAVGGTDFDDSGNQTTFWNSCAGTPCSTTPTSASAKGYIPEIPWNDSCATSGINGCSGVPPCSPTVGPPCLTIVAASGGPSACATGTTSPPGSGIVSGTCAGYPKPAYQTGVTPADNVRDLPDVSLFAADGLNSSFYIVCQSDQNLPGSTGCDLTTFVTTKPFHNFQGVGGTSASAPAFAGIMALVNQKTGQRQGNANFVLYSLFKTEQQLATFPSCNSSGFTAPGPQPSFCVFMDITKSNNAVPCVGGSPNCSKTTSGGSGVLQSGGNPAFNAGPPTAAGYDFATGLGSINVTALLNNWATPALKASTTTISPVSITTTLGTATTISGTVTGTPGTPTGVVIIEDATSGAAIDTATLSGNNYSVTTTMLHAVLGNTGTYTIKAHYGGDGSFGPSDSGTATVSIGKQNAKVIVSFVTFTNTNPPQPILSTGAQSVAYGSPYILRVDVANNAGTICENISTRAVNFVCPTGTVALMDNNAALKDFPNAQTPGATNIANLNARGFIEDQPIQLNAGTHSITATYTADANSSYISSTTANTLALNITQAATNTAVVGSPSVIVSGGNVTLTATISSNSNSSQGPTGTVQFSNGAANLGAPVPCQPKGADVTKNPIVPASCTATLSTTLAAFPPIGVDNRWRWTPLEWLAAAMLLTAIILFLMTLRMRGPRRGFAYGAIALFLITSATLAGCSGSSGGGGGGGGSARTITAKYSGDTNYAASQGSGTVTVQ